jgi:Protein of unknown function (DUF3010)
MRVLGVSLTNAHAALVVIDVHDGSWDLVDTSGTRKIELGDHEDSRALQGFSSAVDTFINSHAIDKIAVRRCTYRGQQRSGAGAIKMEALLQLMPQEVCLVAPQTIAAQFRRSGLSHPESLTQYQRDAFETALSVSIQG